MPPDSFGTVTESDTLMLREMARGLDGDGVENFVANVQRRLDELEAGGFKSQRTKFAPPALLSWRHDGNGGAPGLRLIARRHSLAVAPTAGRGRLVAGCTPPPAPQISNG